MRPFVFLTGYPRHFMNLQNDETPVTDEQLKAMWNEEADRAHGTPPSTSTTAPAPEATHTAAEETAPPPEVTPDEPVTLTRSQLDRIEGELARLKVLDQFGDRMRKAEQHIGGMKTAIDHVERRAVSRAVEAATQAATTASRSAGVATPTESQIADANKHRNTEKWDRLMNDFPEWAEAVEERYGKLLTQPAAPAPAPVAQAPAPAPVPKQEEPASQADLDREYWMTTQARPGWQDTVTSDAFVSWMQSQGPDVKALADSPYSKDAVALLDRYARVARTAIPKTAAQVQAEKQARLRTAAVTHRSEPAPVVRSDTDRTLEEIWNEEAKRLWPK